MAIDLKAVVKGAVDTAFGIAATVQVSGTYHRLVPGAYDPSAGTSPATTVQTSVSVLTGLFSDREVDGERVKSGDKKIVVKTSELPTRPKRDDYFVDSSGARWDLEFVGGEPTESVWILRGRAHT